MALEDLRRRLDALDDRLLELLAERAAIAEEVGRHKREHGLPAWVPVREREILDKVENTDLGSFPNAAAQAVFQQVIATCRSLEQPPTVAYLGPPATFTEIAARTLFGHGGQFLPRADFDGVFEAVSHGEADHGVVPIENSTAGTIREVLDLLAKARLTIIGETYVDIHHCLLSHAPLTAVRAVYSKDTALDQCRDWLERHLPKAKLVPVASTSVGAERAAGTKTGAAIGTELASEVYGLPVSARNIEDRRDNRTRFFALGHSSPPATGRDKTSILLSVPHRPGALVTALSVLRDHNLNMTLIESRPSPFAAFEYLFFIDFEGHRESPEAAAAIDELARVCMLTQVLGSYPRASG